MLRQKLFFSSILGTALLFVTAIQGQDLDPESLIDKEKMKPRGQWYESNVPDTLDLARRADLSLNVMLGNIDPEQEYSVYQSFNFGTTPHEFGGTPLEPSGLTWNIQHKNVRVLPLLRAVTGSDRGLDLEYGTMKNILDQIGPDGIAYVPVEGDNVPKGTSHPVIDGLIVLAMLSWYQRDGNPEWIKWMNLVCQGLDRMAIKRGDRAYYPLESGYRDGEWLWTPWRTAVTPYTPPDEPTLDYQGAEGTVKYDNGVPLQALVKSYELNRDRESLELAQRISRFLLKRSFWVNTQQLGYVGHEHGTFNGHFHGNIRTYAALLDLAVVEKNEWLKQFVRETYDHGRRTGVARMGWFPGWLAPEQADRPDSYAGWSEGCGISDMVVLAVKLIDAGLGDYWDDVDYYVRNQLASQQFTSLEVMRKLSGGDPKNDEVLKRFVGGLGLGEPTAIPPSIFGCCSSNGAIGLYYAWHGITRFDNGIAKVNLFLNRASPWMDIDSYLPYQGKVVLHNKKARTALVRIPAWIDAEELKSFLNGEAVTPPHLGNHLIFESLDKEDEVRLEFPVPEETDQQTIHRTKYTITYRGSTIVDIQPRNSDPQKHPLYQRDLMKATQAPIHRVKRFVSNEIAPLQ